jgi:hypothetical protein
MYAIPPTASPGIEPSSLRSKRRMLPVHHKARPFEAYLVARVGVEPTFQCSEHCDLPLVDPALIGHWLGQQESNLRSLRYQRRALPLSHTPKAASVGLEPTTLRLTAASSTIELQGNALLSMHQRVTQNPVP